MSANAETNVPQAIGEMTDRAIAEETLMWLRTVGQAVAKLQEVGPGGMLKMMMKGGNGLG
jgi:hypothetical protein